MAILRSEFSPHWSSPFNKIKLRNENSVFLKRQRRSRDSTFHVKKKNQSVAKFYIPMSWTTSKLNILHTKIPYSISKHREQNATTSYNKIPHSLLRNTHTQRTNHAKTTRKFYLYQINTRHRKYWSSAFATSKILIVNWKFVQNFLRDTNRRTQGASNTSSKYNCTVITRASNDEQCYCQRCTTSTLLALKRLAASHEISR